MAIFAVIAPTADPRLTEAITRSFEGNFYQIASDQFLVSSPTLTTKQVSEMLGAPDGHVGNVLIIRFSNYTGWHSRDMWEWIAARSTPPTPTGTTVAVNE